MSRERMTYRHSSDVCAVCGKTGGQHYSDYEGSWCYGMERKLQPHNPVFLTKFAYVEDTPEFIDKGL